MNSTATRAPAPLEIRSFSAGDGPAMWALFERIPLEDRAFFAEDVTSRDEFEHWLQRAGGGREFVHVAIERDGGRIVGAAALERQLHGWSRHVGELRIVLHPDCRGRGYGSQLAQHVFGLALELRLEKMMVGMVSTNQASIRIFEKFGFQAEALLVDHVKDTKGQPHDLLLMSHNVADFMARADLYGSLEGSPVTVGAWVRELAAPWDMVRTFGSPALYGLGLPYGDAKPVLLIPALGMPSQALSPLAHWLRRMGYRPIQTDVSLNVDCPAGLARRHEAALISAASTHGQKVVLIGHLGGAHAAAVLATDHPQLVSHVIALDCLDADTPFEAVAALLPSLRRCGIGWCDRCGVGRSLREVVPADVGITELAPRRDTAVKGSAAALPFNGSVYRRLARLLAAIEVRPLATEATVTP